MDQIKSFLSNILKPTHSQDFVYKHDTQVQRKAPALNSNAKGQILSALARTWLPKGCWEQASLIYSLLLYVSFFLLLIATCYTSTTILVWMSVLPTTRQNSSKLIFPSLSWWDIDMFLILFLKIGFPCHGSKLEFLHLVRVEVCCSSGKLQSIPFIPFSPTCDSR